MKMEKVESIDKMGKKKLAYEIKKTTRRNIRSNQF